MATTIKIGNTEIGAGQPVYIVGEIGINHNGDIKVVKKLVDIAASTGLNAVKFQIVKLNAIAAINSAAKTGLFRFAMMAIKNSPPKRKDDAIVNIRMVTSAIRRRT